MAVPSEWSGTPPPVPQDFTPAPRVGEHSRAVLREVGYDEARIDALLQSGAVFE